MQNQTQMNVYLITGFLGAGKTTLLNHLLKSLEGSRNVVIENEFGKASIDGMLIAKQYSQLYELNNGCICCSLDEELYDVLTMLAHSDERPENLFIETTGIADAGTVAEIFKREDVSKVFKLKKVICVTDAETVEDYINETEETIRQIVVSDLIIINKTNFVSADYLVKLENLMISLNPFAEIFLSSDGMIPLEKLENKRKDDFNMTERPVVFTHINSHKIKTVTYKTEDEFYRDYLIHTLNVSLMIHYRQIYRIKGFVKLEGSNEKILLQSTGKRLTLESCGTWNENEVPVSELVFIGVGLETSAIQRILRPAIKKVTNEKLKAMRLAILKG